MYLAKMKLSLGSPVQSSGRLDEMSTPKLNISLQRKLGGGDRFYGPAPTRSATAWSMLLIHARSASVHDEEWLPTELPDPGN